MQSGWNWASAASSLAWQLTLEVRLLCACGLMWPGACSQQELPSKDRLQEEVPCRNEQPPFLCPSSILDVLSGSSCQDYLIIKGERIWQKKIARIGYVLKPSPHIFYWVAFLQVQVVPNIQVKQAFFKFLSVADSIIWFPDSLFLFCLDCFGMSGGRLSLVEALDG